MPLHSRANTGRNDPCPCGSGKKFKHCCLTAVPASPSSPWRDQRDASGRLTQAMLDFAMHTFAEDIPDAWLDFNQDESPLPIEEDPSEGQIFIPYLFFDWDPEPRRRRNPPPGGGLVTRTFLSHHPGLLSELERLILEQAITQPISFYEVVRSDPGEGMRLRDVLIGGEMEVTERTASQTLRLGDLAFGQLCLLPEVVTLGRMAPHVIPPGSKAAIIRLRAKLRKKISKQNRELAAVDLLRYREEIRTTYLDLRDAMRTPPRLTNTDGDPLLLHMLTFRAGSANAAFEALAPLARGVPKNELMKSAELGDDGELRRVEIPWVKQGNRRHEDWENTILGHITISGRSVVVNVNSEKRAVRIRHEIEQRLGVLSVYEKTVTQSPEALLGKQERGRAAPTRASGVAPAPSPILEMDEQMRAAFQHQIENWIYQKVPVLGGRTPLEAVGDADGKEIVESLLLDWERRNETITDPQVFRPDINGLRRLLKLPPSHQSYPN
jgi:hypothetical protein